MTGTVAIFYDGQSSNPQEVNIVLDEGSDAVVFNSLLLKGQSWGLKSMDVGKVGSAIEIKPSDNSLECIRIDDQDFIRAFHKLRKEKGYVGVYHRMVGLGLGVHAALALAILGVIALAYLYFMPWVAEKAVVLIPEDYENTIGDAFFEQYADFSSIDTAKTKALNLFAGQLDLNNTREIKFTVINSETVNAFALPNGNVVVFTGIIDLMQDYDELAGLIGHEVAHVNNRHSMKMMCRNLAGYIFLSAVLSDVNGIMAVIGDNVHSLQSLTYSRRFEHEADEEGLKMLYDNKVNPAGMSKLFTRLQGEHDKFIPEFLSSHPVTEDRIEFIDNTIAKKKAEPVENARLHELFLEIKD